jgi:hypothetical protein
MLQLVRKKFEGDNGYIFKPGDIADTTGWANASVLLEGGYVGPTDAKKPTEITTIVQAPTPPVISAASVSSKQLASRLKRRSVLTGRKRVFQTRRAIQGE